MKKKLSDRWCAEIADQPESGMGYWTGDITLLNGTVVRDVVVCDGWVTEVRGHEDVLFDTAEIASAKFTGRRWKWKA